MQPCSQPRYGLMERSKPMSGLLLKAMALRAPSFSRVVGRGGRSARSASDPQPSSKASRAVASNRTGGVDTAPRPLPGPGRMDEPLCDKPSGMSPFPLCSDDLAVKAFFLSRTEVELLVKAGRVVAWNET